ncbi:MAG: hypothetical protein MK132_23010 [Lentisphaerales bacterium]|nr:hypothetical protein [Lentisphaerales bacterium]
MVNFLKPAFFTCLLVLTGNSLQSRETEFPATKYAQKQSDLDPKALNFYDRYCFGCHDEDLQRCNLDLCKMLNQ